MGSWPRPLRELTVDLPTPRAQADATIRQNPRPGSGSARTQVSPRALPSADDGAHFSVYLVELACPDPTLLPIAFGQGVSGGRSPLGRVLSKRPYPLAVAVPMRCGSLYH